MTDANPFAPAFERLTDVVPAGVTGTVERVTGLALEASGLSVPTGAVCRLRDHLNAEVVGFRERRTILMGHGDLEGVSHGDSIRVLYRSQRVGVGAALLGRVVDAMGRPWMASPLYLPSRGHYACRHRP